MNNHNFSNNFGYLELIIGPMFSGKTSKLLEIYKQCQFCGISVAVINHKSDTRYDNLMLTTHDQLKIPCIQTNELSEVFDQLTTDVILINEGQFFGDLYEVTLHLLTLDKKVYIAGLDGDFERNKFGQIINLIPMCDTVTKLTSWCSQCKNGTKAIFSKRITCEKQQTLVGSDNYIPVCRNCF
jgi:thymidine kinase